MLQALNVLVTLKNLIRQDADLVLEEVNLSIIGRIRGILQQ